MKKFALLAAALAALASLPAARAASHQPGSEKLTVVYQDWQKFTDIKDHYDPTDSGEQGILSDLRKSLEFDAQYVVPDGDHLTLTFTNIDLAGDFEPWRGPNFDDIRIVKSIYPPRFVFTYQLTDSGGRVLKSGKENIVDMSFEMRVTLNTNDPLHYEKDILKDWMDRKIGK